MAVDLHWAPSLKGDLMYNWAIIASKNVFEKYGYRILSQEAYTLPPESASQAYISLFI